MTKKRQYLTTAIDYPNAAPHMGHVLEKVLADVIARWWRVSRDPTVCPRGEDAVRFQIGTDEHGVKIQRTAESEGLTPQALVDKNAPLFQKLYDRLGISYDDFIRTTNRKRHWPTVIALWKKLQEKKVLQKRTYSGLYCAGCEKFLTKKDLVDGKCPNHLMAPEEVEEENWFFLLSKETVWLKDLLTKSEGGYRIVPEFRANETLALLDQGLEDVSFSRPRSSLAWGIPVPGNEEQTMYVWCDALTNYVSTLDCFGLAEGHERGPTGRVEWWNDAEVTHVIGKDIARFHALIWPAMLKHAGVRTPDRLLIHGFITSEGQKMSKSLGNVVEPNEVIDRYGVDPLRFYLSHEVPVGNDGDFSRKRFDELYHAKLRNTVGNLLHRTVTLLQRDGSSVVMPPAKDFLASLSVQYSEYKSAMESFDLSRGLQIALSIAVDGNKFVDARKPWELAANERAGVLSQVAEALRHLSLALLPFLPSTAQEIAVQLGVPYAHEMKEKAFIITDTMREWGGQRDWKRIGEPSILFPPLS